MIQSRWRNLVRRGIFVNYTVEGVIYDRDKQGNRTKIPADRITVSGVVREGRDIVGSIMRQQEELRVCDKITLTTY